MQQIPKIDANSCLEKFFGSLQSLQTSGQTGKIWEMGLKHLKC